jgi:hypothetical protein
MKKQYEKVNMVSNMKKHYDNSMINFRLSELLLGQVAISSGVVEISWS